MAMRWLICFLFAVSTAVAQFERTAPFQALLRSSSPAAPDTNPPVAGFTQWLKSDDYSSMFTNTTSAGSQTSGTSGDRIGFWLDKSIVAGTNHVGVCWTGDRRATLSNNWVNGKPALIWDTATMFQSPTNNYNFGVSTGITVLIVGAIVASGDSFQMVWTLNAGNLTEQADIFEIREWFSDRRLSLDINGNNIHPDVGGNGQNHVWVSRYQTNGTYNITMDGNTNAAGTTTTFYLPKTGYHGLGRRGFAGVPIANKFQGWLCEVITWPFYLSDLQASNCVYYATNSGRWNIHL